MAIIRTDPFREFDRLNQQLWAQSHGPRFLGIPLDAYRRGDSFLIQFDLPGADAESIELTVEDTVLTVKAERPAPPVEEGVDQLVAERLHGTYSRQVLLGDSLDSEHIEASYQDGVLTLTIPVAAQVKPRRIPVASSDVAKDLKA